MNAVEILKSQHREMEAALDAVLEAEGDERRALFEKAADALMAHVSIEEQIFYPAVKAQKTEDILLESLEEHLSLKRVLADLVALSVTDEHFAPKFHVLKEQAEHHHEEEEENLFPKVKKICDADELDRLGEQMTAAREALLRREPRNMVADQTTAATELPAQGHD